MLCVANVACLHNLAMLISDTHTLSLLSFCRSLTHRVDSASKDIEVEDISGQGKLKLVPPSETRVCFKVTLRADLPARDHPYERKIACFFDNRQHLLVPIRFTIRPQAPQNAVRLRIACVCVRAFPPALLTKQPTNRRHRTTLLARSTRTSAR